MKLINKDAVVAEIKKVCKEDSEFLPLDLSEYVEDFKDDLLRTLDTLEEEAFEYVRKDVFIKKAIEWIGYYNQNGGCEFDGWEEDFRLEMEVK